MLWSYEFKLIRKDFSKSMLLKDKYCWAKKWPRQTMQFRKRMAYIAARTACNPADEVHQLRRQVAVTKWDKKKSSQQSWLNVYFYYLFFSLKLHLQRIIKLISHGIICRCDLNTYFNNTLIHSFNIFVFCVAWIGLIHRVRLSQEQHRTKGGFYLI